MLNAQEIAMTARKSYEKLYEEHGIQPNAFIMSESLIQVLVKEVKTEVTMSELERELMGTTAKFKLYDIPVYPITHPVGVVRAVIM